MTALPAIGSPAASGLSVGIDVGGTKLAAALVRFPEAAIVARRLLPTRPERGSRAVLDDVARLAHELAAVAGPPGTSGVGLAVPELVDPQGRITSAATLDWRGVQWQDHFTGLGPVSIEADVRAAAMAEARWGAGQGFAWFVYVSVGTGISSAIVQNGRALTGARGNALVLGSGRYPLVCPSCGARHEQPLESLASGPALVERCRRAGRADLSSSEQVLAAAAADPLAMDVVETAAAALGASVAFLVNVVDPEAVVVGGGLGLAGRPYWDVFVASLRNCIWSPETRALPILPAALGADAGLIGAAATVIEPGNRLLRPGN